MKGDKEMFAKGIKKSVGEFNDWHGHARVMYDYEDRIVWTDVFGSVNEWKEYRCNTVVELFKKGTIPQENFDKVTMEQIKKKVKFVNQNNQRIDLEFALGNLID